jgi:hypothetical protein
LIFEDHVQKKKRGKYRAEFDLNNLLLSRIVKFHKAIGDSLDVSIDDMEDENFRLKERIKELDSTLMQPPILATPISTIQPGRSSNKTPELSLRIKGESSLHSVNMHFVEENIKKMTSLILETWDLANKFVSLGSKIHNTREYLKVDLTIVERFYKDALSTLVIKISGMTEYQIKQEYLSSLIRVKQLKACWIKMINILRELLGDLNALSKKKVEAYSKLTELDLEGTTIEVQDPKLIVNSFLQKRQQFKEHVEIMKGLST